jgi:hypothetical protein
MRSQSQALGEELVFKSSFAFPSLISIFAAYLAGLTSIQASDIGNGKTSNR